MLTGLAPKHDIAKKILDFREYEKLRSTYVDALPKMISKADGRVHTDYRQALAVTGRLSSNNPNLQNIPILREGRLTETHLFRGREILQVAISQMASHSASFAKDATMSDASGTTRHHPRQPLKFLRWTWRR